MAQSKMERVQNGAHVETDPKKETGEAPAPHVLLQRKGHIGFFLFSGVP